MKRLLLFFILFLQLFNVYSKQNEFIDSAYYYQSNKEYDKAISIGYQFLASNPDDLDKADTYYLIAYCYDRKKLTAKAVDNYLLANQFYQKKEYQANVYSNLAVIYKKASLFDQAITYYNKALNLCQEEEKKGIFLINRAMSLKHKGKYDSAFEDVLKVYEIAQKNDSKNLLSKVYNQKGLIKLGTGNYSDAIDNFISLNELNYSGKTYFNLGEATLLSGDTAKAKMIFNNGLADDSQTVDQRFKLLKRLGELNIENKEYKSGLQKFLKAEKLLKQQSYIEAEDLPIYSLISIAYENLGDIKEALTYTRNLNEIQRDYIKMQDELIDKYEAAKIVNRELEFKKKQRQSKEKDNLYFGLRLVICLLLLISVVFFFYRKRILKKLKKISDNLAQIKILVEEN